MAGAFDFGGGYGNGFGSNFGGGGSAFSGGTYGKNPIGPDQTTMSTLGNMMGGAYDFFHQGQLANQDFGHKQALQGADLANRTGIAQLENQGATQRAQIAAQASMFPSIVKQGEFNRIFPYITGFLNNSHGFNPVTIGGQPDISRGGVYSPNQIQQQVNSMRATNDATTEARNRQTANSVAGRGFGANSPLAMMLQNSNQMGNLQASTQGEQSIRQGAAEQNANHLLQSQNAYEQAVEGRAKPYFQQQSALISLLGAFA